jgi:hypothetical protein
MKETKEIPFYPNTGDGMHCVQACIRIILKYFFLGKEYSYEELDKFTYKIEGKGTWWFPFVLKLKEMGLDVVDISPFSLSEYYKRGENYLRENNKPEVADWILQKSNLLEVKKYIPEFLEKIDFQNRTASIEELKRLVNDGWLVGVDLNSRILNKKEGYSSHMVVVFNYKDGIFTLHDPGLPPHPNREVSEELFLQAWEYAGKEHKSLMAIRKS